MKNRNYKVVIHEKGVQSFIYSYKETFEKAEEEKENLESYWLRDEQSVEIVKLIPK